MRAETSKTILVCSAEIVNLLTARRPTFLGHGPCREEQMPDRERPNRNGPRTHGGAERTQREQRDAADAGKRGERGAARMGEESDECVHA